MYSRKCPLCQSNESYPLFHYTYDYLTKIKKTDKDLLSIIGFGEKNKASLVKCNSCYFIYQEQNWEVENKLSTYFDTVDYLNSDKNKVDFKGEFVTAHKKYNKQQSIFMTVLNIIKLSLTYKTHQEKIKILDFGCGWGKWLEFAGVFSFTEAFGFEINNYKCNSIRKRNSEITVTNDLDELRKIDSGFDIIICNQVLEHVDNPRQILNILYDLLADNGLIYIALPIITERKVMRAIEKMKLDAHLKLFHIGHINFFSPKHFNDLTKSIGLKPVQSVLSLSLSGKNSGIKKYIIFIIKYFLMLIGVRVNNVWMKNFNQ